MPSSVNRLILLSVLILWLDDSSAFDLQIPVPADVVYLAGFEGDSIDPAFPVVGGDYVLPAIPIGDQLQWLIDELAVGETTTLAEVRARFVSGFDAASMVSFINDVLRVEFRMPASRT